MYLSDNIKLKNLIYRQLGFAAPTVIIFIFVFLTIPVIYLAFNSSKFGQSQVKGVSSEFEDKKGLYVQVTSENGGWELSEVLCKDLEECKADNKGKKWGTLNGGQTEGSTIKVDYSEMFSTYSYIKLYAKPGWNSGGRNFNATVVGDMSGLEYGEIKDEVGVFDYVIIPLEELKAEKYSFISFTDN